MAEQTKDAHLVCVRMNQEEIHQLDSIAAAWRCNRSDAIRFLIDKADASLPAVAFEEAFVKKARTG